MALSGVNIAGYDRIFSATKAIGVNMDTTTAQLIVLMAVVLIKTLFSWFESFYYTITIERILNAVRKNLFTKVSRLGYQDFIKFNSGELSNVCVTEVEKMFFSTRSFIQTIQSAILLIGYFIAVINLNYKISIIFVVSSALIFLVYRKVVKFISTYSQNISDNSARLNHILLQYFANFKYIKISNIVGSYSFFVEKEILNVEENRKKIGLLNGIIVAIREPVVVLIILVCLLFNFYYIKVESAILVSILFLLYRALNSVNNLQVAWGNFLAGSGSVNKINSFIVELDKMILFGNQSEQPFVFKALEEKSNNSNQLNIENNYLHSSDETSDNNSNSDYQSYNAAEADLDLSSRQPRIRLENVSFSLGDKLIIRNFSLDFYSGKLYIIKGPSGSGKSTLINLISGLYQPDEGRIEIFFQNKEILLSENIRISYVGQEPVMFLDNLWNNITLWDLEINKPEKQQRFIDVLERANLSELIDNYYSSQHGSFEMLANLSISESGNNWSGGQRQRMNIAREIYKDSDVYIFDESTSALDSENKKGVIQTIQNLAKSGKIVLFISHDDQFDSLADQLITL
jgi:ABC-type multidrug transport system fused ATPase/permease subunit